MTKHKEIKIPVHCEIHNGFRYSLGFFLVTLGLKVINKSELTMHLDFGRKDE